jgi:hypothetical protein
LGVIQNLVDWQDLAYSTNDYFLYAIKVIYIETLMTNMPKLFSIGGVLKTNYLYNDNDKLTFHVKLIMQTI